LLITVGCVARDDEEIVELQWCIVVIVLYILLFF